MLFRRRTTAFRSPQPQAGPVPPPRPMHMPTAEPVAIRFLDDPPPAPPRPPTPPRPEPSPPPPPRKRRELPIGTLAFLAVVAGGVVVHHKARWLASIDVQADEVISRTFTVSEGEPPKVTVEVVNGDVEVVRGEPGVVVCTVTRRSSGETHEEAEADLKNLSVSMTNDGNTVNVSARRIAGRVRPGAGTSAKLRVPEGSLVKLKTTNSPIRVEGVEGPVEARTTNGPIEVKDAVGHLALASSNGPIRVEATEAVVLADSSNGPIDFRGSLAAGSSSFHTSNGRVSLKLPSDLAFKVDAKTSNGKISSEFGLSPSRSSKGRALVASVGDAPKVSIKVRSTNGGIRLQEEDN